MWEDLNMKDRAAMIRVAVKNGVTSLEEIRDKYNKFDEGGIKDSWKPWYWFTPKYKASSLEEAIIKAYNDGREGEDILYNDRAYKAILSEEGLKKYYSKNPEKIPRQQRILNNDSPTKKDSEKIENNILNTQNKALEAAEKINRNADYYYIPYIYDKEIKIPGIGRVSENMLDSIAINARRAGLDLQQAVGLATEETKLGAIPGFSLEANKKAYKNKYGKEMSKEQQKALERAAHNSSFSRNHGGIYPQFLVNDHEWSSRGWEKREDLKKALTNIASPLEHAFTLYKKGFYNTGDENHSSKVKKAGKEVMKTKAFKEWYKKYYKK